jgi:hypothetical protein
VPNQYRFFENQGSKNKQYYSFVDNQSSNKRILIEPHELELAKNISVNGDRYFSNIKIIIVRQAFSFANSNYFLQLCGIKSNNNEWDFLTGLHKK